MQTTKRGRGYECVYVSTNLQYTATSVCVCVCNGSAPGIAINEAPRDVYACVFVHTQDQG